MKLDSEKDLIMYYHTTIRNVALMTAVSFAALGYSRFYRGASKLYSVGLSLVSGLILLCSMIINLFLYNSFNDSEHSADMKNWLIINKIFFVVHGLVLSFSLFTTLRLMSGRKFK
jgi:hypothetical protein